MIQPFKLAKRIQNAKTFQSTLFYNYIEYGNDITLNEYAEKERMILGMGLYGVEEYYCKVNEYLNFLDEVILE